MTTNTQMNQVRELTMDELDAVSGGDIIVRHTTIIMKTGTLSIGTISTDGGPELPSAVWVPAGKGGKGGKGPQ
jgi:hypothetical protein